jgi:hypothetical protein
MKFDLALHLREEIFFVLVPFMRKWKTLTLEERVSRKLWKSEMLFWENEESVSERKWKVWVWVKRRKFWWTIVPLEFLFIYASATVCFVWLCHVIGLKWFGMGNEREGYVCHFGRIIGVWCPVWSTCGNVRVTLPHIIFIFQFFLQHFLLIFFWVKYVFDFLNIKLFFNSLKKIELCSL